jgi:hypothetical protein
VEIRDSEIRVLESAFDPMKKAKRPKSHRPFQWCPCLEENWLDVEPPAQCLNAKESTAQ